MIRYLYSLVLSSLMLWAGATDTDMAPYGVDSRNYMKIRILDQKSLSYPNINGHHFSEISDLTYDTKKHLLYMLSDEGKYFIFNAKFGEDISELKPVSAVKLVKKNGHDFRKWRHDSEGMTIDSNGRLIISFEEQAKIGRFDSRGRMVKSYRLPRKLFNIKNYRSKNKSLESVLLHPDYGILTASEYPLKHSGRKEQTIYSLTGKEWHFKAEEATSSAVVSMEMMDDKNLLILERAYSGLANPVVITLKKVWLKECKHKGKKRSLCRSEVLAQFSSGEGWSIDNFEGLARVGKNRYLMISDDNDNFFQRTLLIYFEVIE